MGKSRLLISSENGFRANGRWLMGYVSLFMVVIFFSAPISAHSQPLTLEESITLALQNSPQIKAAQEAIKLAEGQMVEAKGAMLPQISANGSYLYFGELPTTILDFGDMPSPFGPVAGPDAPPTESGPIEIEMGARHNWKGEVAVQQPLFTFGKLWNRYKQTIASQQAAVAGLNSVQQQLELQVHEAFYGVLLAQEYLKVSRQAVELVEAQVKVAQQLRDVEIATDFEVLRAQVQLASVQSQQVRVENTLQLAQNRFKMILGLDMNTAVNVEGSLDYQPQEFDLAALIDTALKHRPDLAQLTWQEKAGEKLVRIAKAGYLPNISIAGNYSLNDTDQQPRYSTWNVAVVANIPIFNGFATRGKVHQAEAGLRQIQYGHEQLRDAIEMEVRTAYLQLRGTAALVEVQRRSVEQAEEGLRLAQLRYENGMLTSVELIDSQLALTQARVNRLQAQHDYVVGLARLQKAIGGE